MLEGGAGTAQLYLPAGCAGWHEAHCHGRALGTLDIVTLDLGTAAVTPLIDTKRSEQMPAWAAREATLVYVTDRNGAAEIWFREPGRQRSTRGD